MNKKEFIIKLMEQTSYDEEKCLVVNDILEDNFFLSKKNKEKIVEDIERELNTGEEEAIRIYDIAVKIINDEIKNKLKHPFRSKD